MTIFPLLFFIISVISLIAIINISEIYFILYKIFPNSAESFLNTVLKLSQSQAAQKSIVITILLSIFFSKDLFVAISQAFSYIYEAKVAEGRVILIISMLALPFLATLILVLYVFLFIVKFLFSNIEKITSGVSKNILFIERIKNFLEFINNKLGLLQIILNLSEVFIFALIIWLIYYFFTPVQEKSKNFIKHVLTISIFISILMFLLKIIFTFLILNLLSVNPLYLTMGSIFTFIIWVKLCFDILLIGERMIYYLEKD
ncbi:MAG: YihY/virulence factor BrkB family protein [Sulfurihydrogenibium sp.]|jgi:membrane protein|nr:YihY/virulence factor BrkB family protein [Sulfurihydrogenibium sp.]